MRKTILVLMLIILSGTYVLKSQPANRGMYVDSTYWILGNPLKEYNLLTFAKNHSISSLSLYSLRGVLLGTGTKLPELSNFIQKAKNEFNIEFVGAVVNDIDMVQGVKNFIAIYEDKDLIDLIVAELDYWNPDEDETIEEKFSEFIGLLDAMKEVAIESDLMTVAFLSSISEEDSLELIVEKLDRAYLGNYKENPYELYDRFRLRLGYLADAVNNIQQINFDVWALFSAEFRSYRGIVAGVNRNFLGPFLRDSCITFKDVEDIFNKDYLEDNSELITNVHVTGFQWFKYSHMFVAMENLPKSGRIHPLNNDTTIVVGNSLDFIIQGSDIDGDLRGCEWYVNNHLIDRTTSLNGYIDTESFNYSFNLPGHYEIKGVVLDTYWYPDTNMVQQSTKWNIDVVNSLNINEKGNLNSYTDKLLWFQNPFKDKIDINFVINNFSYVQLIIINQSGVVEKVLINNYLDPGIKNISWKPNNNGNYFISLIIDGKKVISRKALKIKY